MKRYVSELANDVLNKNKNNELMTDATQNNEKKFIENVLADCESGFISDTEAVYLIARKILGY